MLSVEAGRLGELIEAHECVQRRYPLTQAFLHLLHNTVQVMIRDGQAGGMPRDWGRGVRRICETVAVDGWVG